jgi:hypothetical protein
VGFDFGGEALDLGQHFLEPTGEQMTGIDFVVVIILVDPVFESAMQPQRNAELMPTAPNLMSRAHVPAVFDTGTVIRRSMRRRTGCSTSDGDNMPNDGAETPPLAKRRACTFDWRNISHLSENFHV